MKDAGSRVWTLPWFKSVLHAEVSGLFILEAPTGMALNPADKKEGSSQGGAAKKKDGGLPSLSIAGARDIFNPVRVPKTFEGYKAYPVLVGDIMPWNDCINGTGTWYHAWAHLWRKISDVDNMYNARIEVRQAMLQQFYKAGARPAENGSWIR
jgi:hypothetical protein